MFSDIFKIKKFKDEIFRLKAQNYQLEKLIKEKDLKINELTKKLDFKLSLQAQSAIEIDETINSKKDELKETQNKIEEKAKKLHFLLYKITEKEDELNDLRAEVGDIDSQLESSSYGLYNAKYSFSESWEYKDKLKEIRDNERASVRNDYAVQYNPNWTLDGSLAKGRRMNKKNMKAMLRSFNNECTEAIRKVNYSNYDLIHKRIQKSFEQHNKINNMNQLKINNEYLQYKFDELDLAFGYQVKKEEEKEELRKQRQIEREEKQNKREFERNNKKIDKDINHNKKAIKELEERLSEDNSESLQEEINKLKQKIKSMNAEKKQQAEQMYTPTAGYVYIISNIGAFGKNVFKIGVTRRLKPEERINELSSASVPFRFDVHALIYSNNAFDLEAKLHQRFNDKRVNKINNRKEFFRITIDDIKEELKKYKDVTVDFTEKPEADEYRATLKLNKKEEEQKMMQDILN